MAERLSSISSMSRVNAKRTDQARYHDVRLVQGILVQSISRVFLSDKRYVPRTHRDHLNIKLSTHLRQCPRSLQEEDKERSPIPPIATQTPSLQLS